ncbi:isoleucine--tRNA ligase [Bathymodiolus septemdierum thioautotrophic gill symbiont]|uniref:Isoleucine--tRNA ligase n=1 Tax=endosymbiont of Bathymodiolus septemdierum str. Myojin knoll TaxID=1303921 RepID=A0A0P0URK5_9GAMM|nr:isoleucine--tRNA ligase [Bathymodiolus septemdierum thioautotrophic gill symbiont]BAS67652.1 isoleucyl-tRNA synthetase [endosymbiont of Bathymodiolus septemdierum str. Myojin knoll]
MSDYKSTLNLPFTKFAMKANLANREPNFLKHWQDDNLYARIREKNKGKQPFILHDGPPYANGDIHIGHAVNKVLKDIIIKSKSLSGFDAPFVPGWDCHGLPIELNVEKKKGKVGHKIDANTFRAECRKYADTQVEKQRQDFKRLGILGDWDNPYLTKDFGYEADIVRALAKMVENNHVSKGYKPVHWCTDCASALAEAEVEYKDKQSDAIDVKFKFIDRDFFGVDKPVFVVIWTTTPWTLPANEAVALHPELDYVLVEFGDEYLLLAQELAENALSRYDVEGVITNKSFMGSEMEGLKVQHPFYDKQVPVILGEHVTTDAGTGAVHTAPAHGQEDFVVGLKYDLPVECPVDGRGVFFEDTKLLAGQFIFKANASVIEILKNTNTLVKHEPLSHSYPHCWRHKTPVIFRATPQWFVSMTQNGLRDSVNTEIPKVDWIPDWGKKRIELMVGSRPDWCISRQRFWGVPITMFVHKQTGELHPNTQELFTQVALMIEKNGIEAWFESDIKDFLGDDAQDYDKTTDTLDVWFDSGVSHYAVLKARDGLSEVADLYLEGSDQHRGWFQSSLISSVAMNGKAPYKQVLTHGFTVDKDGKKMSKSLGNVMSPQKVVNSLGADILRLWIAGTDYTGEMTVSDEILKRSADGYRRIRNTVRFMMSNMQGFEVSKHSVGADKMLDLDKWIVSKTADLQTQILEAYEQYNFHHAMQLILNFCTNDLGGFYLDIIKDRQYTTQENSIARRSAQTALHHMTQAMVRWLAPVLSFTAEEIWQTIEVESTESIFLQEWYTELSADYNNKAIDTARTINPFVRKKMEEMRSEKAIGSSLDAEVDIYCSDAIYQSLAKLGDELRFIFITSYARIHPISEQPSDCVVVGEGVAIKVIKSTHKKCVRCWHHRQDIGKNDKHPELCGRCVENVDGDGEKRKFA